MAVFVLTDDIKGQLLEMGICEVLIPLTASPSVEVQGNSAAAIGNLSSKGNSGGPFASFLLMSDCLLQLTTIPLSTLSGKNQLEVCMAI